MNVSVKSYETMLSSQTCKTPDQISGAKLEMKETADHEYTNAKCDYHHSVILVDRCLGRCKAKVVDPQQYSFCVIEDREKL